jgi:hypothetical protein
MEEEGSCRPKHWTYNLDSPPSADLTTNGRVFVIKLYNFEIELLEGVVF